MSDKEVMEHVKNGDIAKIVACADDKPGCPRRSASNSSYRCSLGVYKCAEHGHFQVRLKED